MLKKILFYVGIVIIWQLIYYIGVDVLALWKFYTFPAPLGVLETFIGLLKDNSLIIAILASMKRVLSGYVLSVITGVALGLLIAKFNLLSLNLKPVILGMQTLPSICWLPFAILWFGLNESAIIFVIILGSAFSICLAVEAGIKNINPLYINAARTMGCRRSYLYTRVILPASLPNVITGLKQGWSFAWRALMAGEMMSSTKGLGHILMIGRDVADINQMMCVIIVIILLGLLVDRFVFGRIEKKIRIKWGFV